jgi:excisionase family DNA binding protein
MSEATEKLAYTIQEAAQATGVHKATIWKRVKEGDLTTFKWCGRTLIRAEVLRAALDRAEQGRAA